MSPSLTFTFIRLWFHTFVRAISKQPTAISNLQSHSLLAIRYWQSYYEFATFLYQTTLNPTIARALAVREMPNPPRLRMAIEGARWMRRCSLQNASTDFRYFGRWRERDEVNKEVGSLKLDVGSGGITKAEYLRETQRGQVLLQQGRAGEAERVFRALLARLEKGAVYDSRYDQTLVLGYLGRCLKAQGKPSLAAEHYRAALKLAETLEQDKNVRHQISMYHTDLADVLTDMGQYVEAEKNITSLKINRDVE